MTSPENEATGQETCRCGHTWDHKSVVPTPRYGFWRSMTLFYGVTARPRRIDYVCVRCGQTVKSTTDPALLRDFITE